MVSQHSMREVQQRITGRNEPSLAAPVFGHLRLDYDRDLREVRRHRVIHALLNQDLHRLSLFAWSLDDEFVVDC